MNISRSGQRWTLLLACGFVLSGAGLVQAQMPPVPPIRPPGLIAPPPAPPPPPARTNTTPTLDPNANAPSIEKVNAYLNSLRGLQADFLQVSPDGRSFTGMLYLLRPGKMRFDYDPPATLEIVADGTSVAIKDRKLGTQDTYFISQTPLKFLLQPKIDVAKDSKVLGLTRENNDILLKLEDRSTLGGTSQIRIVFDGLSHALKEWTIIDPHGSETRIILSKLDPGAKPSASLFVVAPFRPNDP
jgi:outer membrane lipoprotein-sorting protein